MQINGGCNAIDTAFNPSLDQFFKKRKKFYSQQNTQYLLVIDCS